MGLISYALRGNYKGYWESLKGVSKECGKKPLFLFIDTALCFVFFGSGLQDYLDYRFYDKSWKERSTFATIGTMDKATKILCPIKWSPFISNKLAFHKNYAAFTHRDYVNFEEGFEGFEAFIEKHPTFVVKPQIGLGGESVRVMKREEIDDLKKFYDKCAEESTLIEELIEQDPSWARMSKRSINTVRIVTGIVGDDVRILSATCRFGAGDSIADNIHSGGCCAYVNLKTGKIEGDAMNMKMERFKTAYDGTPFDGTPIPYWPEIQELCKQAARVNNEIHLVGWDVALAKDGPLLIEGNRGPGFDLVQIPTQKGAKWMIDDLIKRVRAYEKAQGKKA